MIGRTTLALSAVLLQACVSLYWVHPSKDENAFYNDDAQCKVMAYNTNNKSTQIIPADDPNSFVGQWNQMQAITSAMVQEEIYESCMKGAGWRKEAA